MMAVLDATRLQPRFTASERLALAVAVRLEEFVAWRIARRAELCERAAARNAADERLAAAREGCVDRALRLGIRR
jgi:hypothetical protein